MMEFIHSILRTRWAQFALAAAGVALLALAYTQWLKGQRRDAATEAVKIERQEQAGAVIERVERANNASEAIRRDPDARRAQCVQHARNPDDC